MSGLNITVGFSTTNKLMSRLIRWITRGKVSHTWLAFDDPALGTRLVLEAEWYGYFPKSWEVWKKKNILVSEFRLIGPDAAKALQDIGPKIGTKYDWVSAALVGAWKWFGTWLRKRLRSPKRLMCSEAVISVLKKAGYSSVEHFNVEVTSPQRLMDRAFEMSLVYKDQFYVLHADPKVLEYYKRLHGKD